MSERELLDYLQTQRRHARLDHATRARRPRAPARAGHVARAGDGEATPATTPPRCSRVRGLPAGDPVHRLGTFFNAEKRKLVAREGEPLRVALVADAISGTDGVTHTLEQIRRRGVPGFEVEVIGTDAYVDRRLSAVAEVEIPFYAGLNIGVPSLFSLSEALSEGHFDLIHLVSPDRRASRPRSSRRSCACRS